MAFTHVHVKFFFIGFLFSFGEVQNVVSQSAKINASHCHQHPTVHQQSAESKNSQPSNFNKKVVERHNMYRKKHGSPPLTYSKQISQVSQDWANQLAKTDQFKHRPNNKYGENLYLSWNSNPNAQLSPYAPVDTWYAEIKHYNYSQNINIALVGHFTQVVWKNSKELGIGVAKSKTNKYYVVCNYSPPGNVIGQFAQNVLRPTKS